MTLPATNQQPAVQQVEAVEKKEVSRDSDLEGAVSNGLTQAILNQTDDSGMPRLSRRSEKKDDQFSEFAQTIIRNKYAHTKLSGQKETWAEIAYRTAVSVTSKYLPVGTVTRIEKLIKSRKFLPGGRYLSSAGRKKPSVNNCHLFRAEDSSEGWAELMYNSTAALMSGGGIGVDYSGVREEGRWLSGKGGHSTGPLALMQMVNESGRFIRQGGSRRSAIWGGLVWNHPDVFKLITAKNWPEVVVRAKSEDFNFPGPLDGTNISVMLDDDFFAAYHDPKHTQHNLATRVYWACVASMLATGEPGFSVNTGEDSSRTLRNACTELCSADDSDCCNLGSLNLARIDSYDEFCECVEVAVSFLLCGTMYSLLPTPKAYQVREKNRRLGLGLMGVHEWLLQRGYRYGKCAELERWLEAYATSTRTARDYCDKFGISRSVATRAIAPTGTISIVAETTGGIEPIFATAYKRRYLDKTQWKAQYVVDATARRIIDDCVIPPEEVEDAMDLSRDVERRISFQHWMQNYVDHSISSTMNLPPWGTPGNDESKVKPFGETLLRYLPGLRGITAYPDGSRGGQPLTKVPYLEALHQEGVEFVDNSEEGCKSGVCGS